MRRYVRPHRINDTVRLKGLPGLWRLHAQLVGQFPWAAMPISRDNQELNALVVMTSGEYKPYQTTERVVWSVAFPVTMIEKD